MKRLLIIPLVVILVSGLILASCAEPTPAPTPAPAPAPAPAPTPAPAPPQAVELKAWAAWPPEKDPGFPAFNKFIEKVNQKGKEAKLSVKFIGGPETFGSFEGIESCLKGVFEVAYLPPVYMAGVVPEGVVINLEMFSPWEAREKGTFDIMDKFMQRKGLKYLGWTGYPIKFQTYLKDKREKMDLTGLVIRGAPQYVGLIEALGGTMVIIPAGEVYTALETGVAQGMCWPEVGISDWGWDELVKYYWGPPFYIMETIFVMNLDAWNKLHKEQQAVLETLLKEMEREQAAYNTERIKTDREALLKKGLQEIHFSEAEEAQFIKMAYEKGWEYFLKEAPDAAELRPLMTK